MASSTTNAAKSLLDRFAGAWFLTAPCPIVLSRFSKSGRPRSFGTTSISRFRCASCIVTSSGQPCRMEPGAHAIDPDPLILRHRRLANDLYRPTTDVMERDQVAPRVEHRRAGRSGFGVGE